MHAHHALHIYVMMHAHLRLSCALHNFLLTALACSGLVEGGLSAKSLAVSGIKPDSVLCKFITDHWQPCAGTMRTLVPCSGPLAINIVKPTYSAKLTLNVTTPLQ